VRAHWLQGLSTPQTRKLVQVVNGRAVRDRVLQQALLSPFRQSLLPGQFPAVALFVEIEPGLVDVNVHPSKTELRFLDSRTLFRTIESMVQAMVGRHGAPAYVTGTLSEAAALSPLSSGGAAGSYASGHGYPSGAWSAALPATGASAAPHWRAPAHQPAFDLSAWRANDPAAMPSTDDAKDDAAHAAPSATPSHPFAQYRLAGTLFNTYILYDLGQELVLIDQHAADERVRYERLRRRVLDGGTQSAHQTLLLPESVAFDAELRARMEARLPWLERLGFEVEVFGEDSVVFRSVPPEWGAHDTRMRLKGLVERVLAASDAEAHGPLLIDERLFEKLASEACHSSVRGGDHLENPEAEALVRSLFACEHPWNCPHGRPTVVRVPRARLEEWFQRRAPKSDGLQL
jgi:DNA mismatch repair protein MutL